MNSSREHDLVRPPAAGPWRPAVSQNPYPDSAPAETHPRRRLAEPRREPWDDRPDTPWDARPDTPWDDRPLPPRDDRPQGRRSDGEPARRRSDDVPYRTTRPTRYRHPLSRRGRRAVVPIVAVTLGLVASCSAISVARDSGPGAGSDPDRPTTTVADLGAGFTLPWPARGQATVDVEGIGSLGVKGAQRPVPIASVTKVMTALVILRDHPLHGDDQGPRIRIDTSAANESADSDQSTVRVQAGQSFSERDMLRMMLIPSGNNIARQLARWDAGSEPAFVAKMNAAAKSLGMADTTYTGASGFEDTTRSTAVDQLKLAKKIVTDPVFAAIVDEPTATVPGLGTRLVNTNTLLGENGVIGMKTGSSTPAGGALMWAARQPDATGRPRLVLGVVLDQHQGSSANDNLRAVLATSRTLIEGVAGAVATTR